MCFREKDSPKRLGPLDIRNVYETQKIHKNKDSCFAELKKRRYFRKSKKTV
jgi:hypothetical protein